MEERRNWLNGRRPTTLTGAFARTASASSESGSSFGAGSPSPAARDKPRWNTDYAGKLHTRTSSEELTEDETTRTKPYVPYARQPLSPSSRRAKNQEAVKRALERPPLFVNRSQREKPTFAAANRTRREMGARIEETTRELARKSSMSSIGSARNDDDQPLPPPNVPKAWGSKAKKRPHWIQKILSPDLPGATQEEMDALFQKPHPAPFSDTPPLTVDTGAHELTPPASRPASVQPQHLDNDYFTGSVASDEPEQQQYADNDYYTRSVASVEPQRDDDIYRPPPASVRYQSHYDDEISTPSPTDDQFTSRSIEVSQSPAIRVATSLLDEIREREIENLAARAVATNRLGEIRERNSEERDVSPASVRRFSKSPIVPVIKTSTPKSAEEVTEEIPYDPHYKTILEEEGYPIPGTPVWVMSEEAYQAKTGCGPYVPNPEETFQTLRQLAKSLSPQNSPAEQKVEEDKAVIEKIEEDMDTIERLPESVEAVNEAAKISEGGLAEEKREISRSGSPQEKRAAEKPVEPTLRNKMLDIEGNTKRRSTGSIKSDVDPEERITAEAKLFELQDSKSERNSWSAPSRSRSLSPAADMEETPRPVKVDPLTLPTPRVTGAYIETPAQSERKPRKQRASVTRVDREMRSASCDSSASEDSLHSQTGSSQRTALETNYRSRYSSSRRGSDATRLSRTSSQQSSDNEKKPREDSPHPENTQQARLPLINTATIYSAAEDARQLAIAAGIDDSGLDDSTLDEFAAMMEQNPASPSAIDPIDSLIYDEAGFPLSQKQRERKLEILHYERMSKRLYNTSSGIRQTTRGISRIANTLTSLPDPVPQPAVKPVIQEPAQPLVETVVGGVVQSSVKPARPTKVKFGIESEAIEVDFKMDIKWSKVFWEGTEKSSAQGRHKGYWTNGRKLTWIGYICFMFSLFATWFVAESAMCGVFCKPKYASNNNWKYTDPSFPLAIPTKLDQWTGSIVSTSLSNAYDYVEELISPGAAKLRYYSQPNIPNGSRDWWIGRDGAVGINLPEASTFDDDEIL